MNATAVDITDFVAGLSKEDLARLAGAVAERLWAEKPISQFGPVQIHRADGKHIGNLHWPPPDLNDPDTAAFIAEGQKRLRDPKTKYLSLEEFIEQLKQRVHGRELNSPS